VKKIASKLALVLLVFIIFLVMQFPAGQAYALLAGQLGNIQLYEPEGTLWQGKAKALDIENQRFQNIEWQLKPWSIVLGRLNVDWSFDNGDAYGSGIAGLGLGSVIKLSDVKASLPSTMVQPYLPDIPAKLGGVFSVDLSELYYDKSIAVLESIEGKIVWRNAAITVLNEMPLGEFQFTMTTEDSGIVGHLKEADTSDLLAEGQLLLATDNSYKFDATLKVRNPAQRSDLSQGMSFIGRLDEKGQIKLNYSGQLNTSTP